MTETVPCPACREPVRVGARVCPHCRHSFMPIWLRLVGFVLAIMAFLGYWFWLREPLSRWLGW